MTPRTMLTSTDCLRACVASLLDLDPTQVPDFGQVGVRWPAALESFLHQEARLDGLWWPVFPPPPVLPVYSVHEQVIAYGLSPRGDRHAFLVDRRTLEVVHDPDPSRAGLAGPVEVALSLSSCACGEGA